MEGDSAGAAGLPHSTLTIVVPVHDEEASVALFADAMERVMQAQAVS